MIILRQTKTLYDPATAERIAAELTAADEDGWTYTANHDPTGRGLSFAEVRDETGEVLGPL